MKIKYKEGELLEFNEKGDTKLFGLDYTEMVYVEKGTFNIGDNSSGLEKEKEFTIKFKSGYFIGKYPVTQQFYDYIMEANPSFFKSKYRPVEMISWDDISKGDNCFLQKLNLKIFHKYPFCKGLFDLPSEAQWEYAARGGNVWDKLKFKFSGSNNIFDVAWFGRNSNDKTMPVGLKQPNALGLYDMSGNVAEWCKNDYVEDYSQFQKDGTAFIESRDRKVLRGGFFYYPDLNCKVSSRYDATPMDSFDYYGFRLVYQHTKKG
ncbi:formylglycine-generating enzyme family protein [Flectobacillus roseus]|uniref:formylglycine-generating enzyme family protein n=1 Tax=Flectobacillus roseus TaxID=502259 RepID=UPI0024B8026E|nr:formylglycine-generating enzyme family protein [Flectobacillus roseus]MDI9870726.1 formylglycine-generating enzyme family protein [Flectobacillus roseus]